ncbi:MAG: MFS transporter [Actinomycetota bacterium]|nr:MFS transporter [Actinomycetota bacterium]
MAGKRRWIILAFGLSAQTSTSVFLYGLPMLVPQLRAELGISLGEAGAVVGAPAVGLILTLILWGAIADRHGERLVIASGLLLATVFLLWATRLHSVPLLCLALALAGAAGASVNAASGRVVLGWFAAHERGLAMGLRQTAVPLGVAIAALALPAAANRWSVGTALLVPAVLCGLLGLLVLAFVQDPPRGVKGTIAATGSPYRVPTLWRLHSASTMLIVPQFAFSAFSMAYLVGVRHWDPLAAGRVLFVAQLLGAVGRVGAGLWSDRVASRMTPMRQLAVASTLVMLGVAVCDHYHSPLILLVLVLGAVITVADNGLAFAAVAEFAGSAWAGRALGAQNTAQNIASALTPPLLGGLIGAHGYAVGFTVGAIFPVLAIAMTPVRFEQQADQASEPAEAVLILKTGDSPG